jgi:hypothetical protein
MIWEPQSPGWLAVGAEHTYLIHRAYAGDRCVLTRWHTDRADVAGDRDVVLAREIAEHTVPVPGPLDAQRIAESFEHGWSHDAWGQLPATPGWVPMFPPEKKFAPPGSFTTGPATRAGSGPAS